MRMRTGDQTRRQIEDSIRDSKQLGYFPCGKIFRCPYAITGEGSSCLGFTESHYLDSNESGGEE